MKKFILSLFVGLLGIFSITNATNYTIICPDGQGSEVQCTPAPVLNLGGESNICLDFVSVSGNSEEVNQLGYGGLNGRDERSSLSDGKFCFNDNYGTISDLYIYNPGYMFGFTITLSDGQIDTEGGVGEGGSNSGSSLGSILPNGSNDLKPAIDGLYSVVLELLPLFVYLCIGILISIIGFYAIKWLVNYFIGKIKKLF